MRAEPRPRATVGQPEPEPRAASRRAVPLPRTPFGVADELSCYYDAPAEPCNVHIEVRVPGHLDEQALRRAAGTALAEQPRALVRRAPGSRWRRGYTWETPQRPDVDPLTTATWVGETDLAQQRMRFLGASPPLDRSPPVRLLLAAGPDEDCLVLNAHHAALDGISCLDLLGRVARHYPGAAGPVPTGPVTTGAPGPRSAAGPATPDARARPPAGQARPPGLLPRPAVRIAADLESPPGGGPARHERSGYGFQLITCDAVPAARRDGEGPRATVNDLLITALIVAIGRWNAAHGQPAGPVRITMPVNARVPGQAGAVGNLSRLTAVTARPPATGGEVRALIAAVAAQTLAAKNRPGPQVEPLSRALAAPWCPVAVKRRLLRLGLRTAGPLVCDTSLVSNLGIAADPPRFGPVPATHMWFSTSAHMPRGLSVGAITLNGRLHLCLRYRRALFSEPAAARFADGYAAALGDMTSGRAERDRQH
jgi:NRPS condensation-like uncharacterized protein